jgi:hypothetical protein
LREDAEARRRSTLLLFAAVLAAPGAIAVSQGRFGHALPGPGELGVGIFFVAAVSAAVIAGLWVHEGALRRVAAVGAPRSRSGRRGASEEGWIRVPVERVAADAGRPRSSLGRTHERRPPVG